MAIEWQSNPARGAPGGHLEPDAAAREDGRPSGRRGVGWRATGDAGRRPCPVAPIAGSLTQEVAYAMRFPVDSEKRRVVDAARFRASGHAPINRGAGQTGTSD